MHTTPILTVCSVFKTYGESTALNGVSLDLNPGEIFSLLGSNGAGKSTLIKILSGQSSPSSGQVLFNGLEHSPLHLHQRAQIGLVPQDFAFYQELNAFENLMFFGRIHGIPNEDLRIRIPNLLGSIGLEPKDALKKSKWYSGGMKRKLNLAIGMIHQPILLLLDEPTVGVDPESRKEIHGLIRECKNRGTAILVTTHYMEEAQCLSDRLAILDLGRLVICESKKKLMEMAPARIVAVCKTLPTLAGQRFLERFPAARIDRNRIELVQVGGGQPWVDFLNLSLECRLEFEDFQIHQGGLEDVYLELTGHSLDEQ